MAPLAVVLLLASVLASAGERDYSPLPSFLYENTYKMENSFRRGGDAVIGQSTCFAVDLSAYGYSGKRVVISAGHAVRIKPESELKQDIVVRIRTKDGFEWVKAKVLAFDASKDIGLLELDSEVDSVAKLTKKDNLRRGDRLFAVGAPGGTAITPTEGYLDSKEREIAETNEGWWQASFPISPGNSGGPVWDPNRKEIVGILTGGQTSLYGISPNVAYFVSFPSLDQFLRSDEVKKALGNLEEREKKEKKEPKPKSLLSEKAKSYYLHADPP